MIRRRAWFVTTLVVVGLGAAGLYANHQAGSDDQAGSDVATKDPIASVPAGVQTPAAGAEAQTTAKALSKDGKSSSAEPGPRDDEALEEEAAAKPAGYGPPERVKPKVEKPREGKTEEPAIATGNVPADAPPVRNPNRYGDREPYEGAPPAATPDVRHEDRYGDREPSEGVPPGQAPDVRD